MTDLILTGATVRSLDPGRSSATTVAIDGGRIVAVGDDSLCGELRGRRTEIVDLHGAVVTPGLVDSHMHPVSGVGMTDGVDLSGCTDLEQVRASLTAADRAPGEWLTGWGLDPNVFGSLPIGYESIGPVLDGRPALLVLFDGHAAVASKEALRRAGIDRPREFGSRSSIVCDADGRPTGHLLEDGAMSLVDAVVPETPFAVRLEQLATLLGEMAATGLTGAHVMDANDDSIALIEALDEAGRLPLRLRLAPWCRPDDDKDRRAELRALQGRSGRLWSVDAIKLFLDGTIDAGTAWLHEPDCHGESTAAYWRDPHDYRDTVGYFNEAGVQTATHAIGDAAVQYVLDTVAGLISSVRHRIEHIETVPTDQLHRFAELDVVASMQPTHATDYTRADHTDNWSRRLGDERANRGWRCRDLLSAGAPLALGSDWPIAPYDPRGVMAAARSRYPAGRPEVPPVGPGQAITALDALRGYTTGPAYAAGVETTAGRVAVGHRADLTVFAADPTAVGVDELPSLPVLMTVLEGEVRHCDH
jgi:predicted amidohydrolase YtcJ